MSFPFVILGFPVDNGSGCNTTGRAGAAAWRDGCGVPAADAAHGWDGALNMGHNGGGENLP